MLRLIGYWKGSLRDEYPFPQEMRVEYPPGLGDELAAYLESGAVFEQFRGTSWCRFGCPEPNGSRELSDGRWVWPEGLVHYVRRHPVALPEEFVREATDKHRPTTPAPSPSRRRLEVDHSFWVSWARSYRVDAVDTLLGEARKAASRAYEAALDAAADELTEREGLGTSSCITAGCDRLVLAGRAFCARCLADRDRDRLEVQAEFLELRRVIDRLPGALPNRPLQRT